MLNGAQLARDFAARLQALYDAGNSLLPLPFTPGFTFDNFAAMANALRYWYGNNSPLTVRAVGLSGASTLTLEQLQLILWFTYSLQGGAASAPSFQNGQENSFLPGEQPMPAVALEAIGVPSDTQAPAVGVPTGAASPVIVGTPPGTVGLAPTPTTVFLPTPANPTAPASQAGKAPLYVILGLALAGATYALYRYRREISGAADHLDATTHRQRVHASTSELARERRGAAEHRRLVAQRDAMLAT